MGSSYSVAASLYHRIIQSFDEGNLATAQKLQAQCVQFIEVLYQYGYLPATKAVLEMLGVDCGPARPPLVNLSEAAKVTLQSEVEGIGFFDWIKK